MRWLCGAAHETPGEMSVNVVAHERCVLKTECDIRQRPCV